MSLSAQNSGIGLGIVWKGPTGLSAKVWTGDNIAFDAAATWSLDNERTLHLHADMLFHNFNLITNSLPVYYGFGPQVKLADDPIIGVRVPVGIAYQVSEAPFPRFPL